MIPRAYVWLAGAVAFNVASYSLYRAILALPPRIYWPLFLVGLGFGAINTLMFVRALNALPLAIAYPVFTALSFALISLVAAFAFHETLRPLNILGLVVVIVGVALAAYAP